MHRRKQLRAKIRDIKYEKKNNRKTVKIFKTCFGKDKLFTEKDSRDDEAQKSRKLTCVKYHVN